MSHCVIFKEQFLAVSVFKEMRFEFRRFDKCSISGQIQQISVSCVQLAFEVRVIKNEPILCPTFTPRYPSICSSIVLRHITKYRSNNAFLMNINYLYLGIVFCVLCCSLLSSRVTTNAAAISKSSPKRMCSTQRNEFTITESKTIK